MSKGVKIYISYNNNYNFIIINYFFIIINYFFIIINYLDQAGEVSEFIAPHTYQSDTLAATK